MTKIYIENCFCLTFKRLDQSSRRLSGIGDVPDFERKDISYNLDVIAETSGILVTIDGYEPQEINLDEVETSYGTRNYFICDGCQTRHAKLYLLPGGHIFRCKDCHKIVYETFNPSSAQGRFLKHVKKVLKLAERQANMTSRIWYRDVYTAKYEKFLADCLEAGLIEFVAEARELEANIKAHDLKNKTKAEV